MIKNYLNEKSFIFVIVFLGFFLRVILAISRGELCLYSDDRNYIFSAINILKYHEYIYLLKEWKTLSAMPGYPFLLAILFGLFGYDETGLMCVRLVFCAMGSLTIYYTFKCTYICIRSYFAANVAALFTAINLTLISLDNIFLTEGTTIFLFIYLTYSILLFAECQRDVTFIKSLIIYILLVYTRPIFALYPIAFVPFMIWKIRNVRKIIFFILYSGLIISLSLLPWIARNYKITGDFVPFSEGAGTILIGSFEGDNVPEGDKDKIMEKISMEAANSHGEYSEKYYSSKLMEIYGKERMQQWKRDNYWSYLKSTYWDKPKFLITSVYYPVEIFDIKQPLYSKLYHIEQCIACIGLLGCIILTIRREFALLTVLGGMIFLSLLYAHYISRPRYGVTNILIVNILAGMGCFLIYQVISYMRKRLITKNG